MHVYAYYGRGNTIHSPCQIKGFHNSCDENPIMLEANSHHFLDGYATPLECRSGLLYMSILHKPTDQGLDQYPHVLLTSPHKWDPSVLDYDIITHVDTPLGHLTLQLGTNMTPG